MARSIVSILVILVVLSSPVMANGFSKDDFDRRMNRVHSLIERGKWSSAKREIQSLLKHCEGMAYALSRRFEIVECMKICVFRDAFQPSDPKCVFDGEVLAFKPATGQIKLRYKALTPGDFKSTGGRKGTSSFNSGNIHTALFQGTYTIEIKGQSYPEYSYYKSPSVKVMLSKNKGYDVRFGFKTEVVDAKGYRGHKNRTIYVNESKPEIFHWAGRTCKKLESRASSPATAGKPFHLKVVVEKKRISAYFDRRALMKARRAGGAAGRFAISHLAFDEIVISGKLDPDWLEGEFDAVVKERFKEFESTFKPEEHLPDWLLGAYGG